MWQNENSTTFFLKNNLIINLMTLKEQSHRLDSIVTQEFIAAANESVKKESHRLGVIVAQEFIPATKDCTRKREPYARIYE